MVIEAFSADELPIWRALLYDYLLEYDPGSDPAADWDDEFLTACLAGQAAGTHLIWLAKIDGISVGFALARLQDHWYRKAIKVGSVEEFYVAPAHRRTGIGRALAARTIESLHAAGATTITVSVAQANLYALLFWQAVGFSIEAYHLFQRA